MNGIERMNRENQENETPALHTLPKKARIIIAAAIMVPAAVAFIFTQMQWYPATITIEWLTDETGYFPLKKAILINIGALLLAELVVVLFILLIKKLFFNKKAVKQI